MPAIRENEKRARQAEQTPEINQGLAVMRRIGANTTIDDLTTADLTLASKAAQHLAAHPRTLTIDERKALTTFEPIKRSADQRTAELERQEAQEARIQAELERRERELERQARARVAEQKNSAPTM